MNIMDKFNLKGQCSIITGAAMGLGKAMAYALAQAGSSIVIADINIEKAIETEKELINTGIEAIALECDVTKEDSVKNLVKSVIKKFGRIDVLVNNAGICIHEKAENMSLDDWNRVLSVNLSGVFIMSQAVGRIMISQKKGSIINISSMSGMIVNTPQCQCSYNASKGGVIMFTKSLASEWAIHNIRVNSIAPGYMKTELTRPYFESDSEMAKRWISLTPMKRPGEPDELQGIVLYLASEASSFVTGGVFVIDGGYTAW